MVFQLFIQEILLTGSVFQQNDLPQVIGAAFGDLLQLLSSAVKEHREILFLIVRLHSFHAIIPFFSSEEHY